MSYEWLDEQLMLWERWRWLDMFAEARVSSGCGVVV